MKPLPLLGLASVWLLACSQTGEDLAGNSANTGNSQATGILRLPSGAAAPS